MLHLSEPPELRVEVPFSEYHIRRAGDVSALNEFVDTLRGFSREAKFGVLEWTSGFLWQSGGGS